jgi:outer membrane protein OmpA-like peptidoglycan-associated protein
MDINLQLSQARAKSVRDYLIRKGIPSDKVETVGKGVENPISDNETLEGRMQNRRAEIILQ